MRVKDLDVNEFVKLDPTHGEIRVAGQRALLFDATAIGSLRKDLVHQVGPQAARVLLTRFGYVQGWGLAEAGTTEFVWSAEEDQILAGMRIHSIQGMFQTAVGDRGPLSPTGTTLVQSFEAEQHIVHMGRSERPTCWTICGLISGYLTRVLGKELYVLEEKCIGRGDAVCHMYARTWDEWGEGRADELRFFKRDRLKDWLDLSLHEVSSTLVKVEEQLSAKRRILHRILPEAEDAQELVCKSASMRRLIDLARRIAKVDSTVLITGESGTGKERIARLVHEESTRAAGPFIAVNCGAITETLLESELFGHARGAFTGAVQHRPGLFEAANGGTLLLDEIGEVSPGMQVKLLRALQVREVRRVGENRDRAIDVRVIAATNSDLHAEILAGRFRKDLYYRLNVVELKVPALRERREDILPLARMLLAEASVRLKREVHGLSPRAADQILRYDWPGNVRELENAMERAVALADLGRTDLVDLPEEVRSAVPMPDLSGAVKALEDIEKDYILAVLKLNDGNQTRASEVLGIGTATLYRKLKRYGALRSH